MEEPPVTEPVVGEIPLSSPETAAAVEAAGSAEPPPAAAETVEPEMIEAWRVAPHHRREPRQPRAEARARGDRHDGQRRGGERHHGQGRDTEAPGKDRHERPADGEGRRRQFAKPRPEDGKRRPRRFERADGRPEGGRPDASPRPERKERPRDRPIDPDSPFAALEALKKQMEKSRSE
jgi:ATP-dependent RNA helicase SUPV3L1/SUV3